VEVTVVEETANLQVTSPSVQVTVVNGVTVLEVTEEPVRLSITETAPVIQISDVGVQGPPGPQGPAGPAGDEAGLGYVHTQSSPALLVQIQHGFLFKPAGVVAVENDGYSTEWATLSHPATGITELTFGVPFSGVVYVS